MRILYTSNSSIFHYPAYDYTEVMVFYCFALTAFPLGDQHYYRTVTVRLNDKPDFTAVFLSSSKIRRMDITAKNFSIYLNTATVG